MEVLRQLNEKQILEIREHFLRTNDGLTPTEFETVLHDAYRNANLPLDNFRLIELFNEVDVNGDGTMSWEEFTMFLINCNDPTVPKAAIGTSLDDGMVTRYSPGFHRALEVPRSIVAIRTIPRLQLVMRMARTERSGTRVKFSTNTPTLTDIAEIALPTGVHGLCVEYVPPVSGKVSSSAILISCNDCAIRFYDASKSVLDVEHGASEAPVVAAPSHSFMAPDDQPGRLKLIKELRLLESQTVIRWSAQFERMILGSRSGVVSVLDIDAPNVYSHEKLHALLIADMLVRDDLLFTASVDPVNAIKCIDLHRNVVKYAIKDHVQGATLLGLNARTQQLFSVGFDTTILSHAIAMPKVKPFRLIDTTRPHRGRITAIEVVEGTPQVISADSEGLIKVWDIRMNHCVQNLTPRVDDVDCDGLHHGVTCMTYLGTSKRLVACGREMIAYNYDAATNPHLSDDKPAHFVMYNAGTHTLLTIHERTMKLWEASTGMLRSWFKDNFPDEITAACLVTPHERALVVGTYGGEIYVHAFVLGLLQRKLQPRCRMGASEVIQVVYTSHFRDYSNGYVIAAFKKEVIVVADASDDRPFHIRSLDATLETTFVKSIALCRGGFLCIGSADGRMRLVDLLTFNVAWCWGQGHLKGDIMSVTSMPLPTSTAGILFFFSDSCGAVSCATSPRPQSVAHVSSWACRSRRATPDGATGSSGLDSTSGAQPVGSPPSSSSSALPPLHPTGRLNRGGGGGGLNGSVGSPTSLSPRRLTSADVLFGNQGRPNSAVAAYFSSAVRDGSNPAGKAGIYAVAATHLELLRDARMLVVGDERGGLTVWNVHALIVSAIQHASVEANSPPGTPRLPAAEPVFAGQPTVHSHWKAHEDELIAVCSFTHSGCNGFPVIGTSSLDREVRLWSVDGVCLGNISHERITGRPLSHGMKPFLLENPPEAAWSTLGAHLEATNGEFAAFVESMQPTQSFRDHGSFRKRGSIVARAPAVKPLGGDGSDGMASQEEARFAVSINEVAGPVLETPKKADPTDASALVDTTAAPSPALDASPASPKDRQETSTVVFVTDCQTFLTAVTADPARPVDGGELMMSVNEREGFAATTTAGRVQSSRQLRNKAHSRTNPTTRLGSEAYSRSPTVSPRSPQPLRSRQRTAGGGGGSDDAGDDAESELAAGDKLLVGSTSAKLVDLCFSQMRRGFDVKRPDLDVMAELAPRGSNPTDISKESKTPRKPMAVPLWQAGVRPPIVESNETRTLWKKLSHQAICIGTEGERALNNSGRVIVPPAQSGASPSARSLRWRSLT